MSHPKGERTFRSTGEAWEWRKVAVSPKAPTKTAPKGPQKLVRGSRDPREALTITVKYRGGAEGWWELKARGGVLRVPGSIDLHTVLSRIVAGDLRDS